MDLIPPLVSGLIAALLVYLLSRAVKPGPMTRDKRQWVEFGPVYKGLAAAFFPLSAFVTYAALQAADDQKVLAGGIALGFWLGTLYLAYGFYFVRLSYDADSIYPQSPLRKIRRIPWESVTALEYSPVTQAYTLRTRGYGRVSLSPLADGCAAFIDAVAARLDETGSLADSA